MNKTNIFKSSPFYLAQNDVLHLLFEDESGVQANVILGSEGGSLAGPGQVVALPATNITSSGFTANWLLTSNAEGYYLNIATDTDMTPHVSGYENLDVGNVDHLVITGLDNTKTYYYTLNAYNNVGTGVTSNIITVALVFTYVSTYGALYNWYAVSKQHISGVKYGYLYNWYAVNSGIIAPVGWHIPTYYEFSDLITYVGLSTAGAHLKESGTTHWDSPNTGAVDDFGFSALGTGRRLNTNGSFTQLNLYTYLWCNAFGNPYSLQLWNTSANSGMGPLLEKDGASLRFIKDNSTPADCIDYDNNNYGHAVIGSQVWSGANFKGIHYNNGTDIPEVTDNTAWAALTTGGYCAYDNDETNVFNYTNDIAPAGWHVPTKAEILTLISILGDQFHGGDLKEIGTTHWNLPNTDANNSTGFTALGSGMRNGDGTSGLFTNLKETFIFWLSDIDVDPTLGITGELLYDSDQIKPNVGSYENSPKNAGLSVRLIKDDSTDPLTVTIDGNIYPTVKIGTQVWMAKNLDVAHYNDGTLIPNITDNTAWSLAIDGAVCWYNNENIVIIGTNYVTYTDGTSIFRKGVRSHALVVDKAITALGFSGVEGVDWLNAKEIG